MKIDCDDLFPSPPPQQRHSTSIPAEIPLETMKSNEPMRRAIQKSCKGPISISECDDDGQSITIENTSPTKHVDLARWILRQENDQGDILTYIFPPSCLLRAHDSIKVRGFPQFIIDPKG